MPAERREEPLVLLVDDNVDLLQLSEIILQHHGLRVVTAVDGRRALNALKVIQPDVIITDMMMPVLDGLAFMKEYAESGSPRVPIVAVSAFRPYLDQARELGAAAVLQKPYEAKVLATLVRDLAGGRAPEVALPPRASEDETARLQAVLDVQLERAEPGLQAFVDDVAAIFGVPVAGISAVTHDWQQLVVGCRTAPPDPGGPREHSFCTHAVAARSALVIQDAVENPLFRTNPSVTERGFRFYAGVPLMPAQGEAVGTLCILDFQPRPFGYWDLELLGLLSRRVLSTLEWRLRLRTPEVPSSACQYLSLVDTDFNIYARALFSDLVLVWASRACERDEPVALAGLAVAPERLEHTIEQLRTVALGGQIGRLGRSRLGVVVPGKTAKEALEDLKRVVGDDATIVVVDLACYVGATGLALRHVERDLGKAGLVDARNSDNPAA